MMDLSWIVDEYILRWARHPWHNIESFCWLFVAWSAAIADFNGFVRKTVAECIALALISLGAFSRAYYTFVLVDVPTDTLWMSVALAFYCLTLWYKYLFVIPRRPDYKPPRKSMFY